MNRDDEKILTRIETAVMADTLSVAMERMAIYVLALRSVAHESEEEVSTALGAIHDAMTSEIDDVVTMIRSLDHRTDEELL